MQPDFLKLSENISLLLHSYANLGKFCVMEKTGMQILSEIREALDVIHEKLAEVELQLGELEGFMDFSEAPAPVEALVPAEAPAPVEVPGRH